ncbi:MAG TPA: hypothetical protein VJ696_00315 [Rhodanobacteraceae bacterium]|nr:hypothetical protein [Rhodanobacteraceae bacterium]
MSHSATFRAGFAESRSSAVGPAVAAILAAWLLAVCVLAAKGVFLGVPGAPPLALLIAFASPLAAYFIAYRLAEPFRAFVLGIEPRILAGMQAWRFAGFGFIALAAHAILPGYFAWPAGLGDMAIGLTAPWMISILNRRPDFASSGGFVAWNLLGILDLAVAVTLGAVGSFLLAQNGDAVTTVPMATLPLILIPAYLVPLFLMMHFAALAQARAHHA